VGEAMGRGGAWRGTIVAQSADGGCPVVLANDLSRSVTPFDQSSTLVAVIEMSANSWLVAATVPGIERQPMKKLKPDAPTVLKLLERWRMEALKAGRRIYRIVVAFESGRDGFWLARWLIVRGLETHVIHSASVAVSRERKRAKTDRLDATMLLRVVLGWLRGERGHCGMVAIPTLEEEDARRPSRERESLVGERTRIANRMKSALARLGIRGFKPHLRKAPQRLAALCTPEGTGLPPNILEELRRDMTRLALVREQIAAIEKSRIERIERAPNTGPHMMVRLLPASLVLGSRRRTCWCARCCHASYGIDVRWRAMQGSRAHRMRAARSVARRALAKLATPESVVA
jgi:transposase